MDETMPVETDVEEPTFWLMLDELPGEGPGLPMTVQFPPHGLALPVFPAEEKARAFFEAAKHTLAPAVFKEVDSEQLYLVMKAHLEHDVARHALLNPEPLRPDGKPVFPNAHRIEDLLAMKGEPN